MSPDYLALLILACTFALVVVVALIVSWRVKDKPSGRAELIATVEEEQARRRTEKA